MRRQTHKYDLRYSIESFGIAIVVISLLLVITVSFASDGITKNNIDEVMRIIQGKREDATSLPKISIDTSYQDTLYNEFNKNEKLRYDEVKADPACSTFSDNITFTQELAATRKVTLNDTDVTLNYYFTSINLRNNGSLKNPVNVDTSSSREIYTDSDHNLYGFNTENGNFESYRSNSIYNFDGSNDEKQIPNEQAINILVAFIKNLTAKENYQDLKISYKENGSFQITSVFSNEYSIKSSLYSNVSPSGEIKFINLKVFDNDFISAEQVAATDAKLAAYIDKEYKNIDSYTFSRNIDMVNRTPVIYYTVTFTETHGDY
ncbi:MAG: hypothetical protein PHV88_05700, partial [Eubacteriales bacterium]|nr:hypothetical protein [Eubacteriales bacterium]